MPRCVAIIGLGPIVQIGNGVIAVKAVGRVWLLVNARFAPESPCATQSENSQIILLIAGWSKDIYFIEAGVLTFLGQQEDIDGGWTYG